MFSDRFEHLHRMCVLYMGNQTDEQYSSVLRTNVLRGMTQD